MRLPKNFASEGFSEMRKQAATAMAEAQTERDRSQPKRGSFIEDEFRGPSTARTVARWILFILMLCSAAQLLTGLYFVKHGQQLFGLKVTIGGAFFFLIFYATHFILRD